MKHDDFLELLENVHKSGGEHRARCPVHEQRPDGHDLSVKEGDEGILVTCHAGCATPAIVKALGLEMRNLFYDDRDDFENDIPEAVYEYTDSRGNPVFEVVRFPGKRFSQRLAGAAEGEWGLKGLDKKPLFHLPEIQGAILAGRRIWIVEGEKDVLSMQRAGAVATCAVGGAGKWHATYAHSLRGAKHIRIVADKDEPGFAHAEQVSKSLGDIPHEIVQAKQGKDASDHLLAGYGLDDFVPMPKSYGGVSFRKASMYVPGEVQWIPGWEGYFPYAGLSHLAGMPGVNKSTLTALLAATVTKLGYGVFMIPSEDSIEHVMIPRLLAAGANLDLVHFPTKHLTFPHDIDGVQENIEANKIRLMVVDPIDAHLDSAVDSNNNKSIRSALAPLAFMADLTNAAVVLVGHPNKDRFNKDPMLRVGGSIGVPGASRSAMIMGYHPWSSDTSMRAVAVYKGNWAQKPDARLFRVEVAPAGNIGHSIRLSDAGRERRVKPWQLLPSGPTEQEEASE